MPLAEYEYPDPTPEQLQAHIVLASQLMGWKKLDKPPHANLEGGHVTWFDPLRKRCYHGRPFAVEDSGDGQTWYDYSWEQWSPSTDPHAARLLRERLSTLGWRYACAEFVEKGLFNCRLTPVENTAHYVYAAGETLEEALVWAALDVVTALKTERTMDEDPYDHP